MGMNGAISLLEVVENTAYVIAIELITTTQGLRMKGLGKIAPGIRKFIKPVSEIVPPYKVDREHYKDIEGVKELILEGEL